MLSPLCSLWPLLAAGLLGWLLCGWFARQFLRGPEKIVEMPVDRVVEKVVEKTIDNPAQAARIAALTAEVATIAALKSRIQLLESAPPKVMERVVEKPVERPDAAIDLAAAKAAGFALKHADDLEVVEGIGPKIAEIFYAAGVKTFAQLAAMTPAQIQPLLDAAGPNFRIANPETWPDQADLAARNRWSALKAMQDGLTAGRKA